MESVSSFPTVALQGRFGMLYGSLRLPMVVVERPLTREIKLSIRLTYLIEHSNCYVGPPSGKAFRSNRSTNW